MLPLMVIFPFVRVPTEKSKFGVSGRLMVWVIGAAGSAVNPMLPLKPRLLPPNTNAPAAESNVMPVADTPVKSFVLTNRVLPAKVRLVANTGTAPWSQLPPVLQLLFAPPPFHKPVLVALGLITSVQVVPRRTSSCATVDPPLKAPKEMPLKDMSPKPVCTNCAVAPASVDEVGF